MKTIFTLLALVAAANAIELTADTWDTQTAGKSSWCGHCKKMKPAWDELMEFYKDSKHYLVAEVECTTDEGKPLCAEYGVRGYPTIKYGDPADLQDFKGKREIDALKAFAEENLKPLCSLVNPDLCSADQKAALDKYKGMDAGALEVEIAAKTKELKEKEAAKTAQVKKLEDEFSEFKSKNSALLGLMKAVKLSKDTNDEL